MMRIARIVLASALIAGGWSSADASPPAARTPEAGSEVSSAWPDGNFIVNLYDAFGAPSESLTQDFGFSALVRYEGTTILFDSGSSADILKSNVEALGLDLRDIDIAVASHAHFDHINGFDYLLSVNPDVTFYFPADFYWGDTVGFDVTGPEPEVASDLPEEQRYFGGAKTKFQFKQSGRFWKAKIEYVSGHTEIAPGLTLIATDSPYVGYFTRYPSLGGIDTENAGDGVRTINLPELSLNLETADGDVLIVGCSHSLVETIVRTAKNHMQHAVALVYGGYHLLPYRSDEIREIATRMRDELGVASVAPAHCTGHAGFKVFREVFADRYRMAGLGSTLPLARAPGFKPSD